MSHNPLAPQLKGKAAALEGLRRRRSELRAALAWHSTFDRAAAEKEATEQQDRCDDIEAQLTATRDAIEVATQRTSELQAKTEAGWNPRYWFSKDRALAREQLAAHSSDLEDLGTRQTELTEELARSRGQLENAMRTIAKYDRFDRAVAQEQLAALDAELPIRQLEVDKLAERKERLDRQLKGPVEGLRGLQADLERATSQRSSLLADVADLEWDIERADELENRLSAAIYGHDKKKIHEECEAEFGESSPLGVLRGRRRKLTDVRREISDLDGRIRALERNVDKARQRVATIVARGGRDIRSIVIDGNNLCFQDREFIGIAALQPLCRKLRERYEVTVVFDASIRTLLSGPTGKGHPVGEKSLRERFPGTTLHIVAARTQADETILAAAADPHVYVLSNDRFAEYGDKRAVRGKRVITHEIVNRRIFVHDLDINLSFEPQP